MAKRTGTAAKTTRAKPKAANVTTLADARAARDAVKIDARDGLANVFTTMGTGRREGDSYFRQELDENQLSVMYEGDWMSRKAVDIIADDMTQEWRTWQAKTNQITALENAERALNIRGNINQALKYARLFGGGALIISDGGDASKPLVADRVAKGALKYSFAVPKQALIMDGEIQWAPSMPNFGQPEFYQLQLGSGQTRVHYSRITRFIGAPYADWTQEADPWGLPILEALYTAIRDAGLATSAGATLMEEAKVDIVQMENLEAHLQAADSNDKLLQRMNLLKLGKSMYRILLMGGKEKYDTKQLSMANVDKVIYLFMQVVSGATDIPATRFLAQSPAGMNATGEADLRNYATMIKAKQETILAPAIRNLDDMIIRHALGTRPPKIYYEWDSIWQMSPKESAEVTKTLSEADVSYANSGLIPVPALEKAIQQRLIDSGHYPGLEDALAALTPAEMAKRHPEPAPLPAPVAGEDDDDAPDGGE